MCTIQCGVAHVGSTPKLPVCCDPAVRYVVATTLHSSASMLQHLHVIPADGMVLRPGMFSYGRLVHEAFNTSILMLLQMCFELVHRLADVHLSAGARYFICLLLYKEESLTLVRREQSVGPDLNTALMLKSLHTLLIHSLTPAT